MQILGIYVENANIKFIRNVNEKKCFSFLQSTLEKSILEHKILKADKES